MWWSQKIIRGADPVTYYFASSVKNQKKLHRNLVQNFYLDEASVMVIINIMSVLAAFAILLTYDCSAPIMLPWVQQWRSDTFSSASKCQLTLPKNWKILLTGCWHTQHHTKTTSASLRFINLPKKHICRKCNARFYPTMPVKQTVSVCSSSAKHSSILMEDAGLTLNSKGEMVRTSNLVPPSSSGTIVAVAPLALADSSDKDLYLPVNHAPPGPRTNRFSGNKGPTKTKIAVERKVVKEAKQMEAKGKKAAVATRKADNLAKKQEKRISSAKVKASTAAAKA
jgi:hypothetical protein